MGASIQRITMKSKGISSLGSQSFNSASLLLLFKL
jgi:hypothetical protein